MIEISKNLKLEKVTSATAQNFWNNSSEGSFFTNPNFLKKFNEQILLETKKLNFYRKLINFSPYD